MIQLMGKKKEKLAPSHVFIKKAGVGAGDEETAQWVRGLSAFTERMHLGFQNPDQVAYNYL